MAADVTTRAGEHVPTADQRLVTYGVPWSHYEAQLALRGDAPVPRMAYLEGALELMRPSKDHERIKTYIGRLVEAYALQLGAEQDPPAAGSTDALVKRKTYSLEETGRNMGVTWAESGRRVQSSV